MHAIAVWATVKESINCGSMLTDVIHRPERIGWRRRDVFKKENSDMELVHLMEEQEYEFILRRNSPKNLYIELKTGDTSRNIVEIIIQAALTYTSKNSRKIKKVIRVKNSVDMVERFEKYREMVKKRAHEQHKGNMRSTVDGNEVLQFYGTTMNCCGGGKPSKVSEACEDPSCRVCRLIQSGFNMAYLRTNGIQLSTSSEELSENMIKIVEGKNSKKAVIVCRTIAGKVADVVDEKSRDGYDSIKIGGMNSKSGYLMVRNPSAVTAVLPCFVVVFG